MGLYKHIQSLKAQIVDTERVLEMVVDHPLMSIGLKEKLEHLRSELESLPKESFEASVQLLFSGDAVIGSRGIKSSFVGKTISPFQTMVKTEAALQRFGKIGKRGQAKSAANFDLYLTALPVGSFGVELSQLESSDLFENMDVSNAIKRVMVLIESSTISDDSFESAIEKTPKRNLNNLKRFLKEIHNERSVLRMECGEMAIEISNDKISEGYNRVDAAVSVDREEFINGIFRGLLLDSGRFEVLDEDGFKISGFISEKLEEEQLVEYNNRFINQKCKIHLMIHKTSFITGNEKTGYELLEILPEE